MWTGPYVYITDQNHGYEDPDTPIGRQFPVNRPVSIGAGLAGSGAGAIILPGAAIGRNVVVAAGSVVRGEVPDHAWWRASPPGSSASTPRPAGSRRGGGDFAALTRARRAQPKRRATRSAARNSSGCRLT